MDAWINAWKNKLTRSLYLCTFGEINHIFTIVKSHLKNSLVLNKAFIDLLAMQRISQELCIVREHKIMNKSYLKL